MLNVVTGDEGYPAAVLIRGIKCLKTYKDVRRPYINGPGKVTKFLHIDKKLNGMLASLENRLWFEDMGIKIRKFDIKRKPRIGVRCAEQWVKKPWRYLVKNY